MPGHVHQYGCRYFTKKIGGKGSSQIMSQAPLFQYQALPIIKVAVSLCP